MFVVLFFVKDWDECLIEIYDCNGILICSNIYGSFGCVCELGYCYNGFDCFGM